MRLPRSCWGYFLNGDEEMKSTLTENQIPIYYIPIRSATHNLFYELFAKGLPCMLLIERMHCFAFLDGEERLYYIYKISRCLSALSSTLCIREIRASSPRPQPSYIPGLLPTVIHSMVAYVTAKLIALYSECILYGTPTYFAVGTLLCANPR